MNPIMTNFMLSGNRINGGGRSLRNSGGGHGFLPVLLDRINASGGKSVQGNAHPLEVLRKGLLSKGGTLDRIVIKREDIDVLKAFLYRSGYSVEDVDPFLSELMARNSRGEVNLSQFFNGIDKISPSEGKKRHPIILDASMALHFESVLRDLGVSPGETEQIIGAARVDGGGINLGRFISGLEKKRIDYPLPGELSAMLQQPLLTKDLGLPLADAEQVVDKATTETGGLGSNPLVSESDGETPTHLSLITSSAIPELPSALWGFGLSPAEAERVIKTARRDTGDLDLNRLVLELGRIVSDRVPGLDSDKLALEQGSTVSDHPSPVDKSAISRLEAVLVKAGLPPAEATLVIERAGQDTGRLDLRQLVTDLERIIGTTRGKTGKPDPDNLHLESKTVAAQIGEKVRAIIGDAPTHQAMKNTEGALGKVGISAEKPGNLAMKEFIVALERGSDRPAEGIRMTPQIEAGIDRILATATVQDNPKETASPAQLLSRSGLIDPLLGGGSISKGQSAKQLHFGSELAIENSDDNPGSSLSGFLKKVEAASNPLGVRHLQKETEPAAERPLPKGAKPIEMLTDLSSRPVSSESVGGKRAAGERPIPAYLVHQVGRQISRSLLKGQNRIRLQLKPPEMGTLKIDMNMHGNTLKLGIIAENSAIKDLLLSSIPQLREALVEQGVKLDRLDVQIDSFDKSPADLEDGSHQGLERDPTGFQDTDSDTEPGEFPGDDTGHALAESETSDYRLDLVA